MRRPIAPAYVAIAGPLAIALAIEMRDAERPPKASSPREKRHRTENDDANRMQTPRYERADASTPKRATRCPLPCLDAVVRHRVGDPGTWGARMTAMIDPAHDNGQCERRLTVAYVRMQPAQADVVFFESERMYRLLRSNPAHDVALRQLSASAAGGSPVRVRFHAPDDDVIESVRAD